MRTEELRRELEQLADEIEPFEPDALAVHRKVRRSRTMLTTVAAALAILLTIVAVTTVWRGGNDVAVSTSKKEYPAPALRRVDLFVVPGSAAAQRVLEQSPLVNRYTPIARGAIPPGFGTAAPRLDDAACALRQHSGFAVESGVPGRDIAGDLQKALGDDAKVYDITQGRSADVEIFMKPNASERDILGVTLATQQRTQPIESVRFLDHNAAYAEFKEIFKDQPALIESTRPEVLPESFRLNVTDGASPQSVGASFEKLPGVDNVVTGSYWTNVLNLDLFLRPQTNGSDAEVFMKADASDAAVHAIADALSHDTRVVSVAFIDHQNALREFARIFHDQPALVKNTSAQVLPESFRVKLSNVSADTWAVDYKSRVGVDTVITHRHTPAVNPCKSA